MKTLPQLSFGGKPKIKVLADADLVLELFINRKGFVESAEKLLTEIAQSQQVEVYVTDKCLKRIRLEEELGEEAALFVEKMLCDRVIKISSSIRQEARTYGLPDYDSAEEVICAKTERLDAIVTQNPQNFAGTSSLLIWSVESLQTRLQLDENLRLKCDKENLETLSVTLICKEPKVNVIREACPGEISELFIRQLFKGLNSYTPHIFYFSGHDFLTKFRRINDFSEIPYVEFNHFDDWIASDKTLLFLFRNFYSFLKNDCNWSILSIKSLHKHLLKVLQSQFPKKSVNNSEQLPFNYSPHKIKMLQYKHGFERLKLSLTVT